MKVLNDGGEFKKSFREIYPSEFKLQKENDINTEGSFLYLGTKIRDNRYSISLMKSETIFFFPLLERLIYAAMFLLRYFTLNLEQKFISRTTSTYNEFRTSS